MPRPDPAPGPARGEAPSAGGPAVTGALVEGNARLTALTGGVLFVLLAAEGVTILRLRTLLPAHLFIGLLLVPPVALKMASTGRRFAGYYLDHPGFRRAGPPELLLRLLGPLVVVSTLAVFASGIELWLFGRRFGAIWIAAHKLSFVVWFGATAVHVLGHLGRTSDLAIRELAGPGAVPGAITRRSMVGASVLLGVAIALASLAFHSPFVAFFDS